MPARELAEDVARARKEAAQYDHKNVVTQSNSRNEVVYHVNDKDVLEKLEKSGALNKGVLCVNNRYLPMMIDSVI